MKIIKGLIAVFLILGLLLAGCSKTEQSEGKMLADETSEELSEEEQSTYSESAEKIYKNIDEIKAVGEPMKCTWTTPQGGSGTARIYDEFIRTESTFGGNTYYMTDDGIYRYSWTKGAVHGTMIKTELQKKMEAESGVQKINGEYHCISEAVPPEGFAAPEGINFIDVGEVRKG